MFVKEKKKRYWYRQMTWDLRTIDETPVVSFVFPGLYLIAIIIAPPVKQWMDTTSLGWCLGHVSTRGTPLTLLQADVGWFLTIHAGTAFPWSLPTSTWDLIGAVREDETMEGPIIDGTRYPFKNQETIDSEVLVSPRLSTSLHVSPKWKKQKAEKLGLSWILISSNIFQKLHMDLCCLEVWGPRPHLRHSSLKFLGQEFSNEIITIRENMAKCDKCCRMTTWISKNLRYSTGWWFGTFFSIYWE